MLENHPLLKRALFMMAVAISVGAVIGLLAFFITPVSFRTEHKTLWGLIIGGVSGVSANIVLKILDSRKKKKP